MIMNTEKPVGTGKSAIPLTRADIERLRGTVENATQLDLHLQNLQEIDLSYMDLQGANLQGADLRGANLRGTNLSEANLQGANLSEADLDGADLSRACLGDTEVNRVKLHSAKLSYATLRELDLRGFNLAGLDLQNADLNGTDLRGAVLRGADLQGADLSTARLNGPELRGATLHRGAFPDDRGGRGKSIRRRGAPAQAILLEEHSLPLQETDKEVCSMRRWEYQSILLYAESSLVWPGRWWLRQINEQEIPNWKKREPFASVVAYCNYMDEQGWDLIDASYRDSPSSVSLLFKRPYMNKT
jgi:hypothetical protein